MIRGETVDLLAYQVTGVDDFNDETHDWVVEQTLTDVLVAPAATTDVFDSVRPTGDSTSVELHFPKTFNGTLRGKRVRVRGVLYTIEGAPMAYTDANTPTPWHMQATATLVEG